MIGAIIGGVIAAGSALAGGLMGAKAARKRRAQLRRDRQTNQNWYNAKYYEDPLNRADTQQLLELTQEKIRSRNRAASGAAAVAGATEESEAATKQANADMMANIASNLLANNESRKDSIEQQYMSRNQSINDQEAGLDQQRAQNIATAVNGVGNAVANFASGIDK